MGARAYTLIGAKDFQLRRGSTLLEIGSERGEGSTNWLFNYAQRMGLHFITVDFSRDIYERAREIVGSRAFHITGEDFLDLGSPPSLVSFAYLDNVDWIWDAHQKRAVDLGPDSGLRQ